MSDEVEAKLLTLIINDSAALRRAYDMGLRVEAFETPLHASVWDWSVEYWWNSGMAKAPTEMVLDQQFKGFRPHPSVEETLDYLVEFLQRRLAWNAEQEILFKAAASGERDPLESLHRLAEDAWQAAELVHPRYERSDMTNVEEREMRYLAKSAQSERGGGMTLGLPEIDVHTGGVMDGEVVMLAAYTKVGKSFFLANAAWQARLAGYTPLLITLELKRSEMEERIDAYASGVSYDRINKGICRIDEMHKLRAARERIRELGLIHVERPPEGERSVAHIVNRARQLQADYLLIDQLSWMESRTRYGSDQQKAQYAEVIKDLKIDVSNEHAGALPCLLAGQFNRETVKNNPSGRGALWNFAGATEIEQTIDFALGLSRTREERQSLSMRCEILGSRRCEDGAWLLEWELYDKTVMAVRNPIT